MNNVSTSMSLSANADTENVVSNNVFSFPLKKIKTRGSESFSLRRTSASRVYRNVTSVQPLTSPVRTQTSVVVKDEATLNRIKECLLRSSDKYGYRNFVIFLLGINTGLRCGDLLQIRMQDILTENRELKNKITLLEEKTLKRRTIFLNDYVVQAIRDYIGSLDSYTMYSPLFPSRKKIQKTTNGVKDNTGCLSRKSYGRILKEIGDTLEIEHLCTHSMRKSFGYAVYKKFSGQLIQGTYSAIDILQKSFNHSSSSTTMRYIGLEEEVMQDVYDLNL